MQAGPQIWIRSLPGPVALTYEAGPSGFDLYRALTATGIRCGIAAPSKLQKPSGDQVKTDAKDAIHLTRLLRFDEITVVAVPPVEQEAARDLAGWVGFIDPKKEPTIADCRHASPPADRPSGCRLRARQAAAARAGFA
jgi:hypothetical protein